MLSKFYCIFFISSRAKFSLTRTNIYNAHFLLQIGVRQLELNRKPAGLNPEQSCLPTKTVYFLPIFARKQTCEKILTPRKPNPTYPLSFSMLIFQRPA